MSHQGERTEDETNFIGGRNDGGGDQCYYLNKNQTSILEKAREQASATLYHLTNTSLPNYTRVIHNQEPEDFFKEWLYHNLNLEYPYKKYIKLKFDNKDEKPIHLAEQKITLETLQSEFELIYQTLRNLGTVYGEVEESQKRNRKDDQIESMRREMNEPIKTVQDRLKTLQETFEKPVEYLKQDMHYAGQTLENLGASTPSEPIQILYNKGLQHIEAHLLREQLSIMEYLLRIYTYLLENCSKPIE